MRTGKNSSPGTFSPLNLTDTERIQKAYGISVAKNKVNIIEDSEELYNFASGNWPTPVLIIYTEGDTPESDESTYAYLIANMKTRNGLAYGLVDDPKNALNKK
jgi:hypothetical protein